MSTIIIQIIPYCTAPVGTTVYHLVFMHTLLMSRMPTRTAQTEH